MMPHIIVAAEFLIIFVFSVILMTMLKPDTRIYITIISIFFPIIIQFMGRDALTTGTIFILLLYLSYFFDNLKSGKPACLKYDLLIYLLVFLGGVSTVLAVSSGIMVKEQIGAAVRQYVGFLSAMLFFVVMKNYGLQKLRISPEAYRAHIENLLTLFIFLVSVHLVISISLKFHPSIGSTFKIFLSRGMDRLTISGIGEIERIDSFVFRYEQYGEILAVLSPVIIYKIMENRNPVWSIFLLLFAMGEIYAVTRSGIVLFASGVSLSLLYYSRIKLGKSYVLINALLVMLLTTVYFKPDMFKDVSTRFTTALDAYKSTGDVIYSINRSTFHESWHIVKTNISLFGNSLVRVDFHNLFMTTLHQLGIIGTSLFFIILLLPAMRLIKSFRDKAEHEKTLVFACILSIALFLTNEMKFEFTRHSSYQQICWGIIAIFYLVSINHNKKPAWFHPS